jgi:hypothetical protein
MADVAAAALGVASFGPGDGEVGGGTVDGFGDVGEVLFGVEEVDDLDDLREVHLGELPDPRGTISKEDASLGVVESATVGFSEDSLGEGGVFRAGVEAGGGLDGRGVGDGRIANGSARRGIRRPRWRTACLRSLGQLSVCLPRLTS